MREFDGIASEYQQGRPGYPADLFDALQPLKGALVVEGGAGTGIATRELIARGASVISFDTSISMLRRGLDHDGRSPRGVVLADGAFIPIRDSSVDLVCYAQAWHWLDTRYRVDEVARVLKPGGRLAGWWSHPRSDAESWFREIWDLIEASCQTVDRSYRDIDWSLDFSGRNYFEVGAVQVFPWQRRLTIDQWIVDERSKSYIARLATEPREHLLAQIERVLIEQFPSGVAGVDYDTWLWIAERQ